MGWVGGGGVGWGEGGREVAAVVCVRGVCVCARDVLSFVMLVCVRLLFAFLFSFWFFVFDIVRCHLLLVITIVLCSRVIISPRSFVMICP